MGEHYLVLFDADRIKDYVFASGRLREIRGASERVRQLTDQAALEQAYGRWGNGTGEGLIYAGGGAGALVLADRQRAETCCQRLERRYRTGTHAATLTAVAVPVPDGPDRQRAEAEAQDAAARALARRKESRPQAESIPGGAIRFCHSDRLTPASFAMIEPGDPAGVLVSAATAIKRTINRDYRSALRRHRYWQAFTARLRSDRTLWEEAIDPGQDLGTIGAQALPAGYVALVHVDGDRVGETLRKVVRRYGFDGYQRFSEALTAAAEDATGHALADTYGGRPPDKQPDPDTGESRRSLPFDVITVGGDDILLLCTGGSGLTVATALTHYFADGVERELAKHGIDPNHYGITASAGVVIAHDSMPILTLERAGRQLLKRAKERGPAAIDFHVVTTPGLEDVKQIRAREYHDTREAEAILTMRPYPIDRAESLLRHARKLRGLEPPGDPTAGIPNTKLADLYRACRGGQHLLTLNVLGVHAQLDRDRRKLLTEALTVLDSVEHYPFGALNDRSQMRTALLDLVEASEFVAERWEDRA
jgi:hypothetical protein